MPVAEQRKEKHRCCLLFYVLAITILVLHFTGFLARHNLEWLVLLLAAAVFPAVITSSASNRLNKKGSIWALYLKQQPPLRRSALDVALDVTLDRIDIDVHHFHPLQQSLDAVHRR